MSGTCITHESVMFDGPSGALVGTLAYGESASRGTVMLAGPHPYMGGTMDNNVVRALADGLAERGYATLRFDYHALRADTIADSMLAFWTTGHTPQDSELIEEARSAQCWLREQLHDDVHLLGYSFGCEVVSHVCDNDTPSVVLVAPTVKHHDLEGLSEAKCSKLLLYSNNDFATTQLATESWFARITGPKMKRCFVGVDHFFKGCEDEMARLVCQHMDSLSVTEPVGGT